MCNSAQQDMGSNSFWQRLRFKFRISMLNENTLNEVWHVRLSRLGMFFLAVLLFVVTFLILAALIWFTPIRRYLPGYDENIRRSLVSDISRIDSLSYKVQLQDTYIGIIKDVMSGELKADSVESLDSLTILQRTQLLEEASAVTEEFKQQYEEKEKDNLTFFTTHASQPVITLFSPVAGELSSHFSEPDKHYKISIKTAANANVTSILSGTVVYAEHTIEYGYVVIIQHEADYLSLCRQLCSLDVAVGQTVRAGQNIGSAAGGDVDFEFELWQRGVAINPEDVIIF